MLIGMLKGTTLYNPLRNPKNALQRRNVVLAQMQKAGYLTKQQVDTYSVLDLNLNTNNVDRQDANDSYLRAAVQRWLEDWSKENDIDIYKDGLKIYTTIDSRMMSMEPRTGEIKVWVGGINHKYYKFDHVNQSKRQAGSTFKPFAYLAALESGKSPCDKYTDKPVRIYAGS
ncbi:hypothetical protein FQR65_LT17119 [Abscondita terminalis]|nr:hypothetical protein FQR65_LT17119 [Abscondita terminalis]